MGPSTIGVDKISEMISAGMNVARLNFSHGEPSSHLQMVNDIRAASQKLHRPIAIMADLGGPKIRVGKMPNGGLLLTPGQNIILDAVLTGEGNSERIPHSYLPLSSDVKAGDKILLDDGLLQLKVKQIISPQEVCAEVIVGGILKDKKGMNLPDTALSTPALTEKDKKDLQFIKNLKVDYVALSFVRSADDIAMVKNLIGSANIPVIAKIERPEAISQLTQIIKAADGVMVARGDLGIETGQEKVPLLQKRIINETKIFAHPVITATQMLESMINNPIPTRAEVSDVANAVLDGTDAVMLSGETSVGKYPIAAIKTLDSIITEIENSEYYQNRKNDIPVIEGSFSNAIAEATIGLTNHLEVTAIAVYSESGRTAAIMSAHRPFPPIICFSRHKETINRLALYWGVTPLFGEWSQDVRSVIEQAEGELLQKKLVKSGDTIAVTFGMVLDNEPFQTNMLKLWKVR